jgi:hypothetical protein
VSYSFYFHLHVSHIFILWWDCLVDV